MTYQVLPEPLRPTAEAALKFFRKEWGVAKFEREEPISEDIEYCPTLSAVTRDAYLLCVEVSSSAYPGGLDRLIVDCRNHGLPAKVFVAIPKDAGDPQYRENSRRAAASGVGIVEVSGTKGQIIHNALSLSLAGVRRIEKEKFPARYRRPLSDAEQTFREGDPAKGCAGIYDEIEALSRRIAERTYRRGCWTRAIAAGATVKMKFETDSWQSVVQALQKHCESKKCKCEAINDALLGRVLGVIPYRNEVGHKPKTVKELMKRDARLRTRFESAVDILSELVLAAAPLRV